MTDELQAAIACLPELYQPLFGHGSEGVVPRRACVDRLSAIAAALAPFEHEPALIVDVGAAQGFFTLALAERFPQHRCVGVDSLAENVAVCNLLKDKRAANAEFGVCAARAGSIAPLLTGRRNCVLLLNVLHHICTQHGWIETDRMLAEIAETADLAIVELASASERLAWTRDLPQEDSAWLEHFKFVCPIGSFETHIPGVRRSLYLCSSKWVFAGPDKFAFLDAIDRSHDGALPSSETGRRYFLANDAVAKCFSFSGKLGRRNLLELNRELRFLRSPPTGFEAPALLGASLSPASGVIVRSRISGAILSEAIYRPLASDEGRALIASICGDLCKLESRGLYHHDLRPWNTVLGATGGIRLIDYGSISRRKSRVVFEDLIEFSCWLLLSKQAREPWDTHRARLSPRDWPDWLTMLASAIDSTDTIALSFAALRETMDGRCTAPSLPPSSAYQSRSADAWQSLSARLTRALYGITRLTHYGNEAEAYAKSLSRELSFLRDDTQRRIEALTNDFERFRHDAKRQITALTRRAERAESHGRSLSDHLRQKQDEVLRMNDDARQQIAAFAARAGTAEVYAKSLADEVDRLQGDAQTQISAHLHRTETAETYARALADELDRTKRGLDDTRRELDVLKSTLVFRATKWLRKS